MRDKWKKYIWAVLTVVFIAVVSQYIWYSVVIGNNILISGYPLNSQIGVVDVKQGIISGKGRGEGFVAFVPYRVNFPGQYRAVFTVYLESVADLGQAPDPRIGFCDVIFKNKEDSAVSYRYELKTEDFAGTDPARINLTFNNTSDFATVGLRLYQAGNNKLALAKLQVVPAEISSFFNIGNNPLLFLSILLLGWVLLILYRYEPPAYPAPTSPEYRKAQQLSWLMLIGLGVAGIYYTVIGYFGRPFWPDNTFLFSPMDRFMDFYHGVYVPVQDLRYHLNPYVGHWYPVPYFPATFILAKPFALFNNWGIDNSLYFIVIGLFFVLYLYTVLKPISNIYQRLALAGILSFTSYPLLFLLDRGSNEGILFILLALFARYYLKKEYTLSAILLGLAIGMKLYPVVFLVLYLKDKKYKELQITVASAILFTVMGMIMIGFPLGAVFKEISRNLSLFQAQLGQNLAGVNYNHSLYNLIHHVLGNLLGMSINYRWLVKGYLVLAFGFFSGMVFFILRHNLKKWESILLLTMAMIFLPYVSFDYTLIHLYIPILLFLVEPSAEKKDLTLIILFGLLLIPKNYYGIDPKATLGVIINPLLVIAVWFLLGKKYLKQAITERVSQE